MTNTKQVKKLKQVYCKNFTSLQQNMFLNKTFGLSLFIEYLKYLRDLEILESLENTHNSSNLKINTSTITTTIAEFEAYNKIIDTNEKSKKLFHWNNFCELLKQNMREWIALDDSI